MDLFEQFLSKTSDRVNWSTLSNSSSLNDVVEEYKKAGTSVTKEVVSSLRVKLQTEADTHTTYSSSTTANLKDFYDSGGKSLEDLIEYSQKEMGVTDTYLRMREVMTDLKKRITDSGEMPDTTEKLMLAALEKQLILMSAKIPNADEVWRKYQITKEVMNTSLDKYPSRLDINNTTVEPIPEKKLSERSVELYGVKSYEDSNGKLYRPTQTDYSWGEGDEKKDLLGIRATNNTYAGTDMVVSMTLPGKEPIIFGELSQLSYSVYREKVPIRSLGRVTPKGYTRGYRTITGVLVFEVFDRSIVYECMKEIHQNGYRMLMDEMPTFDVTVTMCNEFGHKSSMTLYGVSTFTEGQIMSIDNVTTKNAYEFYAIDIDPMHRLDDDNTLKGSSVINANGNLLTVEEEAANISQYVQPNTGAVRTTSQYTLESTHTSSDSKIETTTGLTAKDLVFTFKEKGIGGVAVEVVKNEADKRVEAAKKVYELQSQLKEDVRDAIKDKVQEALGG